MSFFTDLGMWLRSDKKPFTLLSEALPNSELIAGTNWWLSAPQWHSTAKKISSELGNGWDKDLEYPVLKRSRSRCLFVLDDGPSPCVVKSFDFRYSFGRKIFRHRLFGRNEAINLLLAKQYGLPVPELYAYGETRSGLMCLDSIQLIEYIKDGLNYPEFICQTNHTAQHGLIRVADLVIRLYQSGCLHPDPHYEQFLLSPVGPEQDRIIDFQYAQFSAPSLNQLVYQLAHLLRSLKASHIQLDDALISGMLGHVFETLELTYTDKDHWQERFYLYFQAQVDLDRRQIMKLR
ncbi:MAG: hypothetical protein J7K75_13375 [Desulfuromonas sp.]|nr:hypothetical protein [Desulfuromonas sp.]